MIDRNLRVQRQSVRGQAVENLRAGILSGRFKPGEHLVEGELCDILGVSRPSVREALRSLEAEHLVFLVPNRRPQVAVLLWDEARDIYDTRALLEGEAAALCAVRAAPADHTRMRDALAVFRKAVRQGDGAVLISSTADFYDVILGRCGNRIIEEILRGLRARITMLRRRSMSLPGRAKFSLKEMTDLCEAIASGDAEAARAAARHHVEQACGAAQEVYEREKADTH